MSTTPEQINLWSETPSEHQRLEFKEAKTQFHFDTLCKYYVTLATEGAGNLIFGVGDKPPRPVVGTAAANDPVGMAEKLFQILGFLVDVEEVDQHCCLLYVLHGKMTNQSLLERFSLPEHKMPNASHTISANLAAGKIKIADPAQSAPRYRSYRPFYDTTKEVTS